MNGQESRYFRTALWMDEALLALLEQKEYAAVTVKEICRKAGVNRSTFYLHYETIDDLLAETVEMVNKRFSEKFREVKDADDTTTSVLTNEKYLLPYLTFIQENKQIYKLMHDKPQLFHLQKKSDFLYQRIFDPALTHFRVQENVKKYVFAFYTEGTLAIIRKWLEGDCKDDVGMIVDLIEKNTFAYEKTD